MFVSVFSSRTRLRGVDNTKLQSDPGQHKQSRKEEVAAAHLLRSRLIYYVNKAPNFIRRSFPIFNLIPNIALPKPLTNVTSANFLMMGDEIKIHSANLPQFPKNVKN
nr:hypothetical transcript [Hymenolepis microstoma]